MQAVEEETRGEKSRQHAGNPLDRIDNSRLDVEMAAAASAMRVQDQPEKRSRLFGRRRAKETAYEHQSSRSKASTSRPFEVDLIDTSSYSDWAKAGYKPVLTLTLDHPSPRGDHVTALSVSEAGFLAAAWSAKLAIVDLRGPEVLFSEAERVDPDELIVSLVWTICAEGDG